MATFRNQTGQSIYDLCLQAYGSLDFLVRFCRDNSIADVDAEPPLKEYTYDASLVVAQGAKTAYTTRYVVPTTCDMVTGLMTSAVTSTTTTLTWDATLAGVYEYGYNTTGDTPEVWSTIASTTKVLTGLTEATQYYFFVRNKCAAGVYSTPVSTDWTTEDEVPVPPMVADLILALYSQAGVVRTGTDVTGWTDQSGNGNDMEITDNPPQYETGVFGTKPGLLFSSASPGTGMISVGNLVGLTGEQACNAYVVVLYPVPTVASMQIMYYSSTPGGIIDGQWESYLESAGGGRFTVLARGNVGIGVGQMGSVADTPKVLTERIDFSQTAGNELRMWDNNDDTSYVNGATPNNTGTFAAAPFGLGAIDGHLGAVLLYATNHDNAQRLTMVDWLKGLYDIP